MFRARDDALIIFIMMTTQEIRTKPIPFLTKCINAWKTNLLAIYSGKKNQITEQENESLRIEAISVISQSNI